MYVCMTRTYYYIVCRFTFLYIFMRASLVHPLFFYQRVDRHVSYHIIRRVAALSQQELLQTGSNEILHVATHYVLKLYDGWYTQQLFQPFDRADRSPSVIPAYICVICSRSSKSLRYVYTQTEIASSSYI